MGVMLREERKLVHGRVNALRGLPLLLSGGAVRAIARTSTCVKALYLCRDNIALFFDTHAESNGPMGAILRRQWGTEQLPFVSIVAAEAFVHPAGNGIVVLVPTTDDVVVTSTLRGHVLGNVPDANVLRSYVSGERGGPAPDGQAPGDRQGPHG